MKLLLLFIVLMLIAGCDIEPPEQWEPNQAERKSIFLECLQAAPAGPERIRAASNDWSEVVDSCGRHARSISLRKVEAKK